MFSGIHSLLFGKKQKHKFEDSGDDKSQTSIDNEFVVLERRHSGDFDKNSAMYPDLDLSKQSSSNLPYTTSPSLPNLNEIAADKKEEVKVDMLQSVPFVLSPEVLIFDEQNNKSILAILETLDDLKELGEDSLLDIFNYDFDLEHSVSLQHS